ncbi:MAG: HNH endonuclease signature motif containing protein [Pseudomonadota bacterium]
MEIKNMSDKELLKTTSGLVKKEKYLTLQILKHLAEIERRRLFCDLGFGSLFTYCVGWLGYSENETQIRIAAMRLMKSSPETEKAIAQGEFTLTNAARVGSFIKRKEKDTGIKLSSQQKDQIVLPLIGKTTRQVEKELNKQEAKPKIIHIKISSQTQELLDDYRKEKGFYTDDEILNLLLKKELVAPSKSKKERKTTLQAKSDTRYISVPTKRKVSERAGNQCENISPLTGKRCPEKRGLELDHIRPFAMGAQSDEQNIRLLCKSCNQRHAIMTFGQLTMDRYLNTGNNFTRH